MPRGSISEISLTVASKRQTQGTEWTVVSHGWNGWNEEIQVQGATFLIGRAGKALTPF